MSDTPRTDAALSAGQHATSAELEFYLTSLARTLERETVALRAERDEAKANFKLYRGMFTRIKDQIIAGYGPEEMFRWKEALKENDKGEGKVDAVAALISYFYKLCQAKSKVEAERNALCADNVKLREALEDQDEMKELTARQRAIALLRAVKPELFV